MKGDNLLKELITHLCSLALIYRAEKPQEVLLEIKDDGHPIPIAHQQLCPIGGNWIGPISTTDTGPISTLIREVIEEISLDRPFRDSTELMQIGIAGSKQPFLPTPISDIAVTAQDQRDLLLLKSMFINEPVPYFDFVVDYPTEIILKDDPKSKASGFRVIYSYFGIALDEETWKLLTTLHQRFNNLSNESVTIITNIDEIVKQKRHFAFGHDHAFKQFFKALGIDAVDELEIYPGTSYKKLSRPMEKYDSYFSNYEVLHRPR